MMAIDPSKVPTESMTKAPEPTKIWDSDFPADSEDEIIQNPAPSAGEQIAQANEAEAEEQSEPQEEAEPETEEKPEEVEAAPEQEVADEELGKRAQKRIQQLVRENKEKENRFAEVMEQYVKLQQQQFNLEQEKKRQEQTLETTKREREAKLRALEQTGFDPTNPAHVYLIDVEDRIRYFENSQKQLQAALEYAAYENQKTAYTKELEKNFDDSLKDYNVSPEDKAEFIQLAYMRAEKESLEPKAAIQAVIKPVLKYLPKKNAKVTPSKGQVDPNALKAVAAQGPAGTRKPGDKVVGKKEIKTVEDAADFVFGTPRLFGG